MKPANTVELSIGVLSDFTSVLWDYRNLLTDISVSCAYSVNITLAKDAETCKRVMTFLKRGYDLLIVDSARYAEQEDELLYLLKRHADSLRVFIRRGNAWYLRSLTADHEEPIRLLTKDCQDAVRDMLAEILNQIYRKREQSLAEAK